MITTMIFDLDGTLVQTERLKAISYARAAVALRPELDEEDVIAAFKDVVGLSRREVAQGLLTRFALEAAAKARMDEFGVYAPWQAYVQIRLQIYEKMLADPEIIHGNQWSHNMALLQTARQACRYVALATMSYCAQVQRVLGILELDTAFDFVASRDDVEHGKPDPEIYRLVAHELGVDPAECLVVEDSPAGVQAALAAGMQVIAVSTPFTRQRLHESGLLPADLIVDEPERVTAVAAAIIHQSGA
jgi:HAD superfamily hydrolase (TIGR01509 family)